MSLVFHKNGDNFVQAEALSLKDLETQKEKEFVEREREIRLCFEQNLEQLTGYQLVGSKVELEYELERPTTNEQTENRVSTIRRRKICFEALAFDAQKKQFVAITYNEPTETTERDSVLALRAKTLKAGNSSISKFEYDAARGKLVELYNAKFASNLTVDEVNWKTRRKIVVSSKFDERQINSSLWKNVYISEFSELWQVSYNGEYIGFKEIKTLSSHFIDKSREIIDLYSKFKHVILGLDYVVNDRFLYDQRLSIQTGINQHYITFALQDSKTELIFANISVKKDELICCLYLEKGTLDDPKKLAEELPEYAHSGRANYKLSISDVKDLGYAFFLIQQALNEAKNKYFARQIANKASNENDESEEIVSEEYHLEDKSQEIKYLYYKFKDRIRSLDESIDFKPVKNWVSYFLSSPRKDKFVGIGISKTGLTFSLHIKRGTIDDPQNLAKETPKDAHYGNCTYLVNINDEQNFEYIISLIQQALNEAKQKLATS